MKLLLIIAMKKMNWSQIVTGSKCGVELMAEENTQKTYLNVGVNVGVNEQKLLNLIAKDSAVTAITASEVLSISKRQIERLFSSLKNKGLIRRIGADKGGHWEIVTRAENK